MHAYEKFESNSRSTKEPYKAITRASKSSAVEVTFIRQTRLWGKELKAERCIEKTMFLHTPTGILNAIHKSCVPSSRNAISRPPFSQHSKSMGQTDSSGMCCFCWISGELKALLSQLASWQLTQAARHLQKVLFRTPPPPFLRKSYFAHGERWDSSSFVPTLLLFLSEWMQHMRLRWQMNDAVPCLVTENIKHIPLWIGRSEFCRTVPHRQSASRINLNKLLRQSNNFLLPFIFSGINIY